MADRAYARIQVWGKLRRSKVDELADAADMRAYEIERLVDEGRALDIEDAEVPWGEFDSLERFCTANRLCFLRTNSANIGVDAMVAFSLGDGKLWQYADSDCCGALVSLDEALDAIEKAKSLGGVRRWARKHRRAPEPGVLEWWKRKPRRSDDSAR